MTPEKYGIPDYMVPSLLDYIRHGFLPGDFLRAVLSNDLKEAVGQADRTNTHRLPAYMQYLYNEAPPQCYGSPEKVAAWIKQHDQARRDAAERIEP